MLVGKKMSNKIDYEKLKDLGFNFGAPAAASTAKEEPPEPIVEDTPIPKARYLIVESAGFPIIDLRLQQSQGAESQRRSGQSAREAQRREAERFAAAAQGPVPAAARPTGGVLRGGRGVRGGWRPVRSQPDERVPRRRRRLRRGRLLLNYPY